MILLLVVKVMVLTSRISLLEEEVVMDLLKKKLVDIV